MMTDLCAVAALLVFELPLCLGLHRWFARSAVGQPAQGPAFRAACAAIVATVAVGAACFGWGPRLLFTGLAASVVGYGYFIMFCNSESGRRYRVLLWLARAGGLTHDELRSKYSADDIFRRRLERLHQWGTIAQSAGRWHTVKRFPVWVAQAFHSWARLLGFQWFADEQPWRWQPTHTFGLAVVFTGLLAYAWSVGLVAFMGDSYLLANRAKHIAYEGSLALDNLGGQVYPPLYPLYVSLAYHIRKPTTTHALVLLLNVLAMTSIYFPVRILLRTYANVHGTNLVYGCIALTLLPCLVPYVALYLTEPLYFPLFYWFCALFVLERAQPKWQWAALAGLCLGLCQLTREVASVVLIATGLVTAWEVVQAWYRRQPWGALVGRRVLLLVGFALIVGGWKLYERTQLTYQHESSYINWHDVYQQFTDWSVAQLHLAWLSNCVGYYCTSSLSVATLFVGVLVLRYPRQLLTDSFALFAGLCAFGAAVSVCLFMETFWGGPTLTWNKYLVPYVLPLVVVAVRYRAYLTPTLAVCCAVAVFALAAVHMPSRLGCNMFDALTLFNRITGPLHGWASVGFVVATLVPLGCYLVPHTRWFAGVSYGAVMLAALAVSSHHWQHNGWHNVAALPSTVRAVYDLHRDWPTAPIFYDPRAEPMAFTRVLFYQPWLIQPCPFVDLPEQVRQPGQTVFYLTTHPRPHGVLVHHDHSGLILLRYEAHSFPSEPMRPLPVNWDWLTGASYAEITEVRGERLVVRWLSDHVTVKPLRKPIGRLITPQADVVEEESIAGTHRFGLRIATDGHPRQLVLCVNGREYPPQLVERVLWASDAQALQWEVELIDGPNEISWHSIEPANTLPDGRRVAFIMVGEPWLTE